MMCEVENGTDLEEVYEENWQEKAREGFPPIVTEKFFIHSFDEQPTDDKISLKVPANMAFGNGEHPTTAGCLKLYEKLADDYNFQNGLDMGCGTAILAMAAAKLKGTKFLGVDSLTSKRPSSDLAIPSRPPVAVALVLAVQMTWQFPSIFYFLLNLLL